MDEIQEQPPIDDHVEQEPATEAPEMTYESILRDLLTDLEGMPHMSKTEAQAIVDGARAKLETL